MYYDHIYVLLGLTIYMYRCIMTIYIICIIGFDYIYVYMYVYICIIGFDSMYV